jgi:hypothetical protein
MEAFVCDMHPIQICLTKNQCASTTDLELSHYFSNAALHRINTGEKLADNLIRKTSVISPTGIPGILYRWVSNFVGSG